jgi:hypothetical protein
VSSLSDRPRGRGVLRNRVRLGPTPHPACPDARRDWPGAAWRERENTGSATAHAGSCAFEPATKIRPWSAAGDAGSCPQRVDVDAAGAGILLFSARRGDPAGFAGRGPWEGPGRAANLRIKEKREIGLSGPAKDVGASTRSSTALPLHRNRGRPSRRRFPRFRYSPQLP